MSDERESRREARRLQRLSNAIMDTLAESCGVDINVAKIIASFLSGITEGDRVTAYYPGCKRMYYGAVDKINGDGTFQVKYDDGDFWAECPRSQLELLNPVVVVITEGDWLTAGWYNGTIDKINGDGTYQVRSDDGFVRLWIIESVYVKINDRLSNAIINTPLAESCGVDINVAKIIASFLIGIAEGDRVVAHYKKSKKMWLGTIDKINGDGTFRVMYDDGDFWAACPRSKLKLLNCSDVLITERYNGKIDKINGGREARLLQHLSNAIMDTPLAESCGVDIDIAKIIASFLIGIAEGDRVGVLFSGKICNGTIHKINGDETFQVMYDDWHVSVACPRSQLLLIPSDPVIIEGDRVNLPLYKGGRYSYDGTIHKINGDGTYQVLYDDGYFSAACPRSQLKLLS